MKLLIIGASGLVGSNLRRAALTRGHEVIGTRRNQDIAGLVPLQLSDEESCRRLLGEFTPDVVVCCAAWPWVDGCESDPKKAFLENCSQPAQLARMSAECGANYVYLSTSYVFDGKHGPYTEEDIPSPINVYGRTKLQGENAVLQATGGFAIIARTMGVYGVETQRKNFVYQVIDRLSQGQPMKVPVDQFGNTTYADDLSAMLLELMERKATGFWNCAGIDPSHCRKDFALKIAEAYKLDSSLFEFIATEELKQSAKRPIQAGLLIDKIMRVTGVNPVEWKTIL
jgi:dTDP-4-dehydrorhamnose reductase